MKLIIEKHLNLTKVLTRLKNWKLDFDVEYVNNIQDKQFEISVSSDKEWSIIMPKENVAFVYDYNLHKDSTSNYAGGAFIGRFSVIVYGNESANTLTLRIIHEYLHSIGKNSDECKKYIVKILPCWYKIFYIVGLYKPNCNREMEQEIFYKWLLEN